MTWCKVQSEGTSLEVIGVRMPDVGGWEIRSLPGNFWKVDWKLLKLWMIHSGTHWLVQSDWGILRDLKRDFLDSRRMPRPKSADLRPIAEHRSLQCQVWYLCFSSIFSEFRFVCKSKWETTDVLLKQPNIRFGTRGGTAKPVTTTPWASLDAPLDLSIGCHQFPRNSQVQSLANFGGEALGNKYEKVIRGKGLSFFSPKSAGVVIVWCLWVIPM